MNLTESSGSDDHNHHVGGARTALALTARWRRAQAMLGAVVTASALAGSMVAGAATTTFGVLLDTDNNINSGCTISTADGSFAGVELVLNTTVVANSTGYRVTGITLQSCTGSSLSAPVTLDSAAYPVARGFGANGTSAVETYIPTAYLPQSGLKMRIGLTTSGADGITGADALLSSNGAPILFDAPPPLVVPALSTMALGLTALLLALAVWYARRRGWHGMQLVVVAVFAISLSGQIIAAIVRDGLITDWSGVSALATDPLGDAPAGTDVSALYATYDGPNLYFRIDAALNSPPVANPQSVTAKVGETLNITLTGSDYEGATLSYAVLVPPTQGVLGGTAPNVTYTPNANATASDSFTFKVNDGTLDSATATVSITNTRAPQITSANSAIFIPTQANSFTFASNGMPTPTAAFGGCTPALPSVTFVADANGGGTLSGSPLVSEAGPHTCTFTSTNGVTPNATQSFTLTVGGAPTITSAATVSVPELAPFTHTVTTTSVGLPITGMAQPTGTLPSAVTFTYAGTPAATATVGGTPAVCTRGTYPISLTASNIVGTTTQNFTLTVRPVNQAPSFTAGATVTVNEDSGPQTVAGWATALNKGAPCESAQVLTFEITGNTNSALFSTQPAVNGTNGNLTFTPAPNANGTATITLRVRDDGGVVDGGVDVSATQNFVINVTPVNDAPVLTAGATLAYTENGPAAVIDNTITITDIDSANLVGATVVISGNYQNGQDVLAFVNASGITGNFVAGTGTLTLTGSSSLANYQAALRSVTYVNTSDNPSALTRTVSWTVDDGGATANLSNTATSSINVTPVNDAPVVVAGNTVTYMENSPAIALSPSLTANDVDSANLTAATVQITSNYFNGQDVLSFVNAGGITGVFSAATGTMTLTGSASVATWQTALRSVSYVNTSENPSTLSRTVTWIVNDGAALSLPVTSTVNVVAVNDAPVLTAGATLAFTEGGSAAVVDGTVTVSDVDSVNLTSATVQITANYVNGEDVLGFVNAGGITGAFAPATGTLTLTGAATLANYQAALRSVTYNNTSITPSTLARTVTWIGNDGALPSAPVTSTINVTAVNSPPTINSVAPATATEGALYTYGATRIDADGPGQTWSLLGTNTCAGAAIVPATGVYTFTPAGPVPPASCVVAIQVCDGGTPNLCATQTTTVTITPVNDAPVINSTAPTPATEDVAYTYNATRNDPDGPGQTWSLTASNTCAGASIVAGTGVYTYTPVGPTPPASCVIGIQVCDGGTPNLCATQNTTLVITAVNSAPTISSAAPTTATEGSLYTYNATRTDLDGPGQTWSLLGTHTCGGSIVAGTGVFTFTPAGPVPPASCVVAIQVCDGGTPNLCATQTTTVTITPVNDAPVINSTAPTPATEDVAYTYNATRNDPDGPGQTWSLTASNTCAGASIVAGTGVYTYTPVGPTPPASCVIGIQVCDGGTPNLCATQNTTLAITAVNSAPTISSAAPTTATEGSLYTYNATRTDLDGPGQTWSLLGTHTCGGSIVAGTGVFTFTPAGPVPPASCVVAIQVCDGGTPNLCATQTTTVTITPVNDAPVINSTAPTPATEDVAYTYNATRLDPDGPGQTWSLTASNTCAGASIVAGTGVYTYTPVGPTPPASCVIGIQVCDGGTPNLCATQTTTLNITAVNDAPVINSAAPTTATEDTLYTYTATRVDPDGPAQAWSIAGTNTCAGASIVAGTGVYTFTPAGPIPPASCDVGIQVCDNGTPNLCATQTTTVTIIAVNDPPIPTNPGTLAARVHIPVTFPAATLGGTDPDLGVVTIDTVPTSVLAGATVTINADGSFTFSPPAEATGTVVGFAYRVCDNGNPGPGVCSAYQNVSFNLTGPTIYYVKTAAVGSGNCTLTNECTLATALTNIGALTGRTIFISDSAIYTQAVTLNSGGSLYGQGVTGASFDAVFGTSVPPVGAIPARPAINATRPFITSTGVTVALNSNNTVRGLNLTGTAGPTVSGNNFGTLTASDLSITGGLPALSLINGAAAATFDAVSSTGGATGVLLNAVTGTLNINGGAISGATATGFSVIGGTATINNAATVTSGAGARSISVTGKTSGTATFSGAVTDNGTGISLTSNTGGTINFTGVITASTGGNTAFNATGGGTVAATNTASTLTSTTGTALNVTNTTIGAGNLVFRSISVNGATTGINLSSTGSSGGLTVLGNSAGNCGGSVVDKNTVATAPVTADCTGGTIQNAATGIRLDNTANVSLTRMRITGNATHNFGIYATNTTNFSLNRSVIDGTIGVTTGGQDAPLVFGKLDVVGDPGINGLSGTANAITDSWIQGGIEHNVEIYGQSNNFGLTVTRTVVKSNSVGGGADGIQMELQGTAVGRVLVDNSQFDDNKSQAIQAASNGSSTVHFTLQNSRWSKTTQGNEGVVFSNGSNGQLFVDINNNLVPGTPAAGFGGAAIFVGQTPGNATASSRLHATVRNNTVTTPTTATNHTLIAYPTSTVGAGAPGFVRFENNTVTNHGLFNGIIVNTPDAGTNPNFHATVLNNNITHTDSVNAVNPIAINARQSSTACLHIANNAATVPPSTGFVGVRARQVAPALVTLYDVPPAGTTAAFELAANHPTATTEVIGTITLTGVICTSPTAPSAP